MKINKGLRVLLVVGIATAIAAVIFPYVSGIGLSEVANWGTSRGLRACLSQAEGRAAQSGVGSVYSTLADGCYQRHQAPVGIGDFRGSQASFLGVFNYGRGAFVGHFTNTRTDLVVTQFEVTVKLKNKANIRHSAVFAYQWVEPGGQASFRVEIDELREISVPGAYEWTITNTKGVRVAF